MTLSSYVDSLVETYYDCGEDSELMEYVERWEKSQPKPSERTRQKEVSSRRQLREATVSKAKQCLRDEFPELFAYPDVHTQREERASTELAAMVEQFQQPRTRHVSQQLHAYKCWRGAFVQHGVVPDCAALSQTTYEQLGVLFPNANGPAEWAILFGFADQLPADQQDPERIEALQYQGFHYPRDCAYVQKDHDRLLRDVTEAAAAREAEQIRLQRDAERQQRQARAQTTYTQTDCHKKKAVRGGFLVSIRRAAKAFVSELIGLVEETVDLTGETFDGCYPGDEPD